MAVIQRAAVAAGVTIIAAGISGIPALAARARPALTVAGSLAPVTAYVANDYSGTVTPVRTATNTALRAIRVGGGPVAVAMTPNGKAAYVVNARSDTVTPIRTATNTALAPIAVGSHPVAIAITPDGNAAGSWPAVYNGNFLLGPATATLPTIEVALPVHINSVTAKVDAFGKLTVHGCTYVTWELGREHAGMQVSVEYSAHSTGPWTLLGKMRTSIRFSCAADKGYEFVGRFPVKLASAYYRVDWPGSAYLQPATTKAVLAGRHLTKITGLKVSATSVTRNSHLTVSGQLWQDNKGWHAYGGRRVLIILRPKGSTKWYWMAKPHTNSAGHFTATFADPASAHWSAVYEGDKTHYASGAKIINVSVSAGLPGRLSRAPDPGWLSHLVPAVNSAEMAKLLRL